MNHAARIHLHKRPLFPGSLDIVGDVHGEIDALGNLMHALGYSKLGVHPEGRRLVFVGDLVDYGPDSPAVLRLVKTLVEKGHAQCVLGDHEVSLLTGERHQHNTWWFDQRETLALSVTPVEEDERKLLEQFLLTLPLVLERSDVRVVHACWDTGSIDEMVFACTGMSLPSLFEHGDERARKWIDNRYGLTARLAEERLQYADLLKDPNWFAKLLPAIAEADTIAQMTHCGRLLTSGAEGVAAKPFWADGEWRMVRKLNWWDAYQDARPVIIGHYWRPYHDYLIQLAANADPRLSSTTRECDWIGKRSNVFCVDYGAGADLGPGPQGLSGNTGRLAALRIPEWQVVFDNGQGVELGPPRLTWR